MRSFQSEKSTPFDNVPHKPNQILGDLDNESVRDILFTWNFIHQQRDVLDFENIPQIYENSEDTEVEVEGKAEDKKRLHLDTSFKSIMIYIYWYPQVKNSLAQKLCTLLFYSHFVSGTTNLHQNLIMQILRVDRFTIPFIFFVITENEVLLNCDDIADIPHNTLFNMFNTLIKEYLQSPMGWQSSKKTPNSIYNRTRVLGSDKEGVVYYLLNGFLFGNASERWYIFNLPSQVDDLIDKLSLSCEEDLINQITTLRQFIKTDRKVAQEFVVVKKGLTPSTHYKTFSQLKGVSPFSDEVRETIQTAIKDFAWFVVSVEKYGDGETVPIQTEEVLSENNTNEKGLILNTNASQVNTEKSDNEMSQDNDSTSEKEKESESSTKMSEDSESSSDGSKDRKTHKPTLSQRERRMKARIPFQRNQQTSALPENWYTTEIETLNSGELNEIIDYVSDELIGLPTVNEGNYKSVVSDVIELIGLLVGTLPNKFFKRGFEFVRDYVVKNCTKASGVSFLVGAVTLLDNSVEKEVKSNTSGE
ncbi:hypothetical protein EIN_424390 [Entamoeba invadens IP1]|uniref:Uncharacterized protein n=1 Tax=Entamoeba invadens IP1 TaxID=370355 RepID=A0A0A1U5V5_ENTIV|nr:hypothetical protein EIN_424390 [Entamoeba invadens IP1]ELP89757.1 hypothetical protein EIN_424390 [Entamoeba invadens IP1]|eukprot:XP_004256528.1 hypothetical protein EIN_424390 [Entamoeba invadens IP1]